MPEASAGNFKRHAAPGESHIKRFSDVGSIPTGSTSCKALLKLTFLQGFVIMNYLN